MTRRNLRDEALSKTASLRSTADVPSEAPAADVARIPRTGPGQLGALAVAQQRIHELERRAATDSSRRRLSVDALDPNPWQPRRRFDDAALQELAANIKENGQLQPVVARPDPAKPGRFQIVMGERRWRAHRLLERTDLDVAIVEFSDVQMAIAALSENIQREDLTDFEVSQSLRVIQKEFPTRKDVAEAIGISRTQLHRLTAFQKLPGFVQDDLQAQPGLLGASAAGDVASALSRHGENGAALLLELWPALKAGQIEQGRLAQAIDARAAAGSGAAMRAGGHVRTFYRDGAKAGDIRRDARHFTVRLRNSYVDEELEKKIKEFMDGLFPAA